MSCSGFMPPILQSSNTVSLRVSRARIFLPFSVMVVKSYFTPSDAVIAMPTGVACSVPMCSVFGAVTPRIISREPTATLLRSSPRPSATSSGRPGSRLPPPTRNTACGAVPFARSISEQTVSASSFSAGSSSRATSSRVIVRWLKRISVYSVCGSVQVLMRSASLNSTRSCFISDSVISSPAIVAIP